MRKLLLTLAGAITAFGQATTNISFNLTYVSTGDVAKHLFVLTESGSAGALGNATLQVDGSAPVSATT